MWTHLTQKRQVDSPHLASVVYNVGIYIWTSHVDSLIKSTERKKYFINTISTQHRHLDKTDASHSESCTEIHAAFTYFSQKLMFELIQSLTVYYIKNALKRSQHSERVVWMKPRSLKMDVQWFSVLELEGDVHLVLNKMHIK